MKYQLSDMARDYKEDERNLGELREQLEEMKEQKRKDKIRHDAKKEMAENIIDDLEGMKKEVERTVENQPVEEAEAWESMVRKYVMEMKGYSRPRHPEPDKDLRQLQTLVMVGKIVEENKEPEEVL